MLSMIALLIQTQIVQSPEIMGNQPHIEGRRIRAAGPGSRRRSIGRGRNDREKLRAIARIDLGSDRGRWRIRSANRGCPRRVMVG